MNIRKYTRLQNDEKHNAQRNLEGRSYYVSDDNLRFHHSRVLYSSAYANGLLFGIVTSDALDMHNTMRGFRYVIFDICGNVISRVDLDQAFKTKAKALKELDVALANTDAKKATLDAVKRESDSNKLECDAILAMVTA
jgi:UDP-N-acetylmuramyl tripeptide synthase